MRWLAVLLVLPFAGVALADDATTAPTGQDSTQAAAPSKPWELDLSVNYTPKYFFRGYSQPPGPGVNIQPSGDFSYQVFQSGDWTLTPHVGAWENITSKTGPDDPKAFSESDAYGGLKVDYKAFDLDTIYTLYSYPNRSQKQVQEIGSTLSYDDSSFFTNTPYFNSIAPHVAFFHETDDLGSHTSPDYIEVGVQPGLKPINIVKVPVTLSVPVTAGLTPNSYYTHTNGHNEVFGFLLVGLKASAPIACVPSSLGSWNINTEVDYIDLNADSAKAADSGDSSDLVFQLGLSVTF